MANLQDGGESKKLLTELLGTWGVQEGDDDQIKEVAEAMVAEVEDYAVTLPEVALKEGCIKQLQRDLANVGKTVGFLGPDAERETRQSLVLKKWARDINASLQKFDRSELEKAACKRSNNQEAVRFVEEFDQFRSTVKSVSEIGGQNQPRHEQMTDDTSDASGTRHNGTAQEHDRATTGVLRETESERAVNIRASHVKNALASVCAVLIRLTLAEGRHGTLKKELDAVTQLVEDANGQQEQYEEEKKNQTPLLS